MSLALQTFKPEPADMRNRADMSRAQVRLIEHRAYERGVREGAAAAAEAAQEERIALSRSLCESLEDALLHRAQLEASVNRETQATLEALLQALLPRALPAALATQVSHEVRQALNKAPRVHPVVTCAPGRIEALAAALEPIKDRCSLREDPVLPPNRAEVVWDQCESWIDLEPVVIALTTAVSRPKPAPEQNPNAERRAHGK
ncbi:MAG: hypothetical protein AAGA78_04230 [Pseudomonadota bacterium]